MNDIGYAVLLIGGGFFALAAIAGIEFLAFELWARFRHRRR